MASRGGRMHRASAGVGETSPFRRRLKDSKGAGARAFVFRVSDSDSDSMSLAAPPSSRGGAAARAAIPSPAGKLVPVRGAPIPRPRRTLRRAYEAAQGRASSAVKRRRTAPGPRQSASPLSKDRLGGDADPSSGDEAEAQGPRPDRPDKNGSAGSPAAAGRAARRARRRPSAAASPAAGGDGADEAVAASESGDESASASAPEDSDESFCPDGAGGRGRVAPAAAPSAPPPAASKRGARSAGARRRSAPTPEDGAAEPELPAAGATPAPVKRGRRSRGGGPSTPAAAASGDVPRTGGAAGGPSLGIPIVIPRGVTEQNSLMVELEHGSMSLNGDTGTVGAFRVEDDKAVLDLKGQLFEGPVFESCTCAVVSVTTKQAKVEAASNFACHAAHTRDVLETLRGVTADPAEFSTMGFFGDVDVNVGAREEERQAKQLARQAKRKRRRSGAGAPSESVGHAEGEAD